MNYSEPLLSIHTHRDFTATLRFIKTSPKRIISGIYSRCLMLLFSCNKDATFQQCSYFSNDSVIILSWMFASKRTNHFITFRTYRRISLKGGDKTYKIIVKKYIKHPILFYFNVYVTSLNHKQIKQVILSKKFNKTKNEAMLRKLKFARCFSHISGIY